MVVKRAPRNGPASVVQVVENAEITKAVERLVRELRLSGLLGFDFIIEEGTGVPWLIEMNPRATQMSHLNLGPGRDLPSCLRKLFWNEPAADSAPDTRDTTLALFPQEWRRDPASEFLKRGYHDVPWGEPGLIRACLREDLRVRVWSVLSTTAPSWIRRPRIRIGGAGIRALARVFPRLPGTRPVTEGE
jgi:hypothetical protein